ncbi:MAG: hypothetical protein SF028_15880 [Candidatus Sumerlaeia bacterium]|nr:hypothetical protein [Candidatus Sumerlaeia bacterium]
MSLSLVYSHRIASIAPLLLPLLAFSQATQYAPFPLPPQQLNETAFHNPREATQSDLLPTSLTPTVWFPENECVDPALTMEGIADFAVIEFRGEYYLFPTRYGNGVPVSNSRDLVNWFPFRTALAACRTLAPRSLARG